MNMRDNSNLYNIQLGKNFSHLCSQITQGIIQFMLKKNSHLKKWKFFSALVILRFCRLFTDLDFYSHYQHRVPKGEEAILLPHRLFISGQHLLSPCQRRHKHDKR